MRRVSSSLSIKFGRLSRIARWGAVSSGASPWLSARNLTSFRRSSDGVLTPCHSSIRTIVMSHPSGVFRILLMRSNPPSVCRRWHPEQRLMSMSSPFDTGTPDSSAWQLEEEATRKARVCAIVMAPVVSMNPRPLPPWSAHSVAIASPIQRLSYRSIQKRELIPSCFVVASLSRVEHYRANGRSRSPTS